MKHAERLAYEHKVDRYANLRIAADAAKLLATALDRAIGNTDTGTPERGRITETRDNVADIEDQLFEALERAFDALG